MNLQWHEIKRLFQITVTVLFISSLLSGCTNNEAESVPGTPNVSPAQAKEIAQKEYGITDVKVVTLRHLTDEEFQSLNDKQQKLTPIYYVIDALADGKAVTVYISSHDSNHHFIK